MKITKREIIFSIIIVSVMLIIGFTISSGISVGLLEKYQKYDTAVQIDNESDKFQYCCRTNIGNTLAYGTLFAVDTVTYPEISGKYSYIEKVKERYTKHTRRVKNSKYGYRTETYWTWDKIDSESRHSKQLEFLGVKFNYIPLDEYSYYIKTIKESSCIRYKYYVSDTKFNGTIFTNLNDNTLNDIIFYRNLSIDRTIEYVESNLELIIFWIIWIIVIVLFVLGFCYLDNEWLED